MKEFIRDVKEIILLVEKYIGDKLTLFEKLYIFVACTKYRKDLKKDIVVLYLGEEYRIKWIY